MKNTMKIHSYFLPNTLVEEAAAEVVAVVTVAALVELAPNKGFWPPKTDEVCAAPPKVEAAEKL